MLPYSTFFSIHKSFIIEAYYLMLLPSSGQLLLVSTIRVHESITN